MGSNYTKPMTAEQLRSMADDLYDEGFAPYRSKDIAEDLMAAAATIDARDACIAELTARAEQAERERDGMRALLPKAWDQGWGHSGEGFNYEHGADGKRVAEMRADDIAALTRESQHDS